MDNWGEYLQIALQYGQVAWHYFLVVVSALSQVLFGMFLILGYMCLRMLRSDKWDDSNILNALRVISHFVAHPHDCAKMFYLDEEQLMLLWKNDMDPKKPFHYINKDEFSELMKTRPWND